MSDQVTIEMQDGRRLPLPLPWCAAEFALPGNMGVYEGGRVVAIYDETTRTGAILCDWPHPFWKTYQPIMRDDFFGALVPDHNDAFRASIKGQGAPTVPAQGHRSSPRAR